MSDPGPISLDDDHIQARVARTEKPEINAISTIIVAANAQLLRRLDLHTRTPGRGGPPSR